MTRTEEVIAAFVAALAAMAGSTPALPAPTRNLALADMLDALDAPAEGHLNVVDGSTINRATILGAPVLYELAQAVEVEWIVQAAAQADRDTAFDAGLVAIADTVDALNAAIEADASPGGIAHAEITSIDRTNLAIDGSAQLKGASIVVTLEFTSPRPF